MSQKGISKDLQLRVREYLKFILDYDNTLKDEAQTFTKLLTKALREEIMVEINQKMMRKCRLT